MTAARRWWLEPVPVGRVAAMRALVYLFIPLDVLVFTPWVADHADIPPELYQPLIVGELLPLPVPTRGFVLVLQWLVIATALAAATGRAPRLLGAAAFGCYFEWMIVAMSYGKVDHDRFAFLVALAVLPTVGRARFADRTLSEAAGWALRSVQVAAVLTYFLAGWAKLRFGGLDWVTGATLARAILRRGTAFSEWLLAHPDLLVAGQVAMIGLELLSPLLLLARSDRARIAAVAGLLGFHLAVFAGITIIFLPHVVALAAFLPLERAGEVPSTLAHRYPRWAASPRWASPRTVSPSRWPPLSRWAPGRRSAGSEQAGVPPGSRDRLADTNR